MICQNCGYDFANETFEQFRKTIVGGWYHQAKCCGREECKEAFHYERRVAEAAKQGPPSRSTRKRWAQMKERGENIEEAEEEFANKAAVQAEIEDKNRK